MTDYDFSTLNDKEFENISIELVSIDKQKRFERFKQGRDGGIDGRFYGNNGKEEIIQCKHYLKTGFDGLIRSLKKKSDKNISEIDKVKKLNPEKYIFTTSLPLSADNKKTIKKLFTPYIKNDNDIYGQEDLNDLLSKNDKVEEKYYKLWISSTTVLNRMLNNAINGRSESLIEDIKNNSKYYVITDNHNKGLKKINESNVIIIAGEPGIGKTTLAEHIALYFIEKDFEFYDIENLINEAENVFDKDKKQVFYFDDFMGSNYLDAIESKKDSHIMKFIERIKKDKNKRFILTSRTNIFYQSISLSDVFFSKNIDNEEFIIEINSLQDIDKAMILYNNIYHSNLPDEYKNELYLNKRYKDIIKHSNFNPRIISFITDFNRIKKENITSENYWKYICFKLDTPKDIWKHTFDKGSDEFTRTLVILVVLNGNKINEKQLKESFTKYNNLTNTKNDSHMSKEFDSLIPEIIKYFLNRNINTLKQTYYTLFNPSVADFILSRYSGEYEKLIPFYKSLKTMESLENLYSLSINSNKRIDPITYKKILITLYEETDIHNIENIDYNIQLFYMIEMITPSFEYNKEKTILFIQNTIDTPQNFNLIDRFTSLLLFIFEDGNLKIPNYSFIHSLILNARIDEEEINNIIKLVNELKINDENIINELNNLIRMFLEYELDGKFSDLGINDVDFESDPDTIYKIEEDYMKDSIDYMIEESIKKIDTFQGININKNKISEFVDIDYKSEELVNAYIESYSDYDEYDHKDVSSSIHIDSIDDLFER